MHHSRRPLKQIRTETQQLGDALGWTCTGPELPTDLPDIELRRASIVRAFIGSPDLILLEEPTRDGHERLIVPLIQRIGQVRDRGTAVIWFTRRLQRILDNENLGDARRMSLTQGKLQEQSS